MASVALQSLRITEGNCNLRAHLLRLLCAVSHHYVVSVQADGAPDNATEYEHPLKWSGHNLFCPRLDVWNPDDPYEAPENMSKSL